MRRPLVLILLVGLTPLAIFALVVAGSGVRPALWQPPDIWTDQFGTPNDNNGVASVSADTSAVYASGFVGNPGFTATTLLFVNRYDLNGRQVWSKQSPSSGDTATSIAVGADGVYAAEQLNGTALIRKYDFDGSLIWTSPFRNVGVGVTSATGISVGASGVYVVGRAIGEYDFSGNSVWTYDLGNFTGAVNVYAGVEGVYLAGSLCCNAQYVGGVVQKYDFNGTLGWTRRLYDPPGSICSCTPGGIASDGQGIVVAGSYDNPFDLTQGFVRKYDLNGVELWTTKFSSPDHSSFALAASANRSGIYTTITTGAGHTFVMKYDGNGNQLWSFQIQAQPLSHPYIQSIPISVGENGFYVGGALRKTSGSDAYFAGFSQSSSLILFGVNPPLSFIILIVLIGGCTASLFFFRRRRQERLRPSRVAPPSSPRID